MQIVNREKKSKGRNPKEGKKREIIIIKKTRPLPHLFPSSSSTFRLFFSSPFSQVVFCLCVCIYYTKLSFPCSRGYKSLVCVLRFPNVSVTSKKRDRERERRRNQQNFVFLFGVYLLLLRFSMLKTDEIIGDSQRFQS